MPRQFKAPAPPPPTTPSSKLRTPMKNQMSRKNSGPSNLSLVAAFDDLMRNSAVFQDGAESQLLVLVKCTREMQNKWRDAESERQRLKLLLGEREKELSARDLKIKQAREMVDVEMRERQKIESERDNLQKQWFALQDMINKGGNHSLINNETLEMIRKNYSPAASRVQRTPSAKRNYYREQDNMAPLVEQSAESLIDASELSFDDSREDILDGSKLRSGGGQVYKRRSSNTRRTGGRRSHSMGTEKLIATATISLHPNGHAEAEAMVETPQLREIVKRRRESRERENQQLHKPSAPPMPTITTPINTPNIHRTYSNAGNSIHNRPHKFQPKKMLGKRIECAICNKKVHFGKTFMICQDCSLACHMECKLELATPCLRGGITRTPTNKGGNYLADYAPVARPMVPALLEFCMEEVIKRGVKEVGIYRIAGSEGESKELMEKILHGKGPMPDLSKYEIHTVTSCVKKFLRSLKEPVIPLSMWNLFVDSAACDDAAMYQAISELPPPNRDTLAFIILHLLMVAANDDKNKMDMNNLAKVMGPTIVGYSSNDPVAIISESEYQLRVMLALLKLSEDGSYWKNLLTPKESNVFAYLKSSTPETMFEPYVGYSPKPMTGGPARRTRSRQHNAKQQLFQSPMIY